MFKKKKKSRLRTCDKVRFFMVEPRGWWLCRCLLYNSFNFAM